MTNISGSKISSKECCDCKKIDVPVKFTEIKGILLSICWKCFKTREIENRFTFHPIIGNQAAMYSANRAAAKQLALRLIEVCPSSTELDVALEKLDEVVYWSNAAIARNT